MNLEGIDVFVGVVDAESFAGAARRLGMPATTVSAKIARLEDRLGITLIQRTTRQLRVTPAGRSYYERCVRALAEIAEGEQELAAVSEQPAGMLRISAPPDLAEALLAPLFERFLQSHPQVSIDLKITNRHVDLIAERVDLAFRVGPLEDSTLVVRKFRSVPVCLWATEAYLKRHGTPETAADLVGHRLVRLSPLKTLLKSPSGDVVDLKMESQIATDDINSVKALTLRGLGIAALPDFTGESTEPGQRLVRIMPSYESEPVPVYFVYPAQRFVSKAVRAFIALAADDQSRHGKSEWH